MKISIVTPTLNAERFFRTTLDSIWADHGAEIEHIVVDGGSTDGTLDIAAEYPARVITGKDGGMYEAINKGLAAVTGDVFGYVNADDEVPAGAFAALTEALGRDPGAGWVVSPTVFIDANGQELATLRPPRRMSPRRFRALGWNCIPQPSTYWLTAFAREVGEFDTTYRMAGDYDYLIRSLDRQRPLYVPTPLSRFRLHDANLSLAHDAIAAESRRITAEPPMPGAVRLALRWATKLQLNVMNPRWALGKRTGRVRY